MLHYVGYIGEFEYVDDHRAGKIVVELNGRLNKCGVISPRFDVGIKEIEGWTARLLPSRQVSLLHYFPAHKLLVVVCTLDSSSANCALAQWRQLSTFHLWQYPSCYLPKRLKWVCKRKIMLQVLYTTDWTNLTR